SETRVSSRGASAAGGRGEQAEAVPGDARQRDRAHAAEAERRPGVVAARDRILGVDAERAAVVAQVHPVVLHRMHDRLLPGGNRERTDVDARVELDALALTQRARVARGRRVVGRWADRRARAD